jgi:hypothetical protein
VDALGALTFCCTNGLVCRLSYSGGTLGTRLVYPYSIKMAKNGNQILTAFCFPDGKAERFIYSQITEVTPEPIMSVEQGHIPNQEWLFNYPAAPSLFSAALKRDVTIRGANGDFVGTKSWLEASHPQQQPMQQPQQQPQQGNLNQFGPSTQPALPEGGIKPF